MLFFCTKVIPKWKFFQKFVRLMKMMALASICLLLALTLVSCAESTPTAQVKLNFPTPFPKEADLPSSAPATTPVPGSAPTSTAVEKQSPTRTQDPTPTKTANPTGFSCPNAPDLRLQVGDSARVTINNGLPLRVRQEPNIDKDNVLTELKEGTQFKITDGPMCVTSKDRRSTFVFWMIEISDKRIKGWVAEGDWEDYFIEPWP